MTDDLADHDVAAPGRSDRRGFIRRAGVGAAIAGGVWVAPAILSIDSAGAAGTCIPRSVQIKASPSCSYPGGQVTTTSTDGPYTVPAGCLPAGWVNGSLVPTTYTRSGSGACTSGVTFDFSGSGCVPVAASWVQICPSSSQCTQVNPARCYTCGTVTPVGNQVTFPTPPTAGGCQYVTFRIQLCCY